MSLVEVWVSSRLLQRQGLWVQQTWVWHKPYSSWRRSSLTPPQSHQNLHRTRKQTLGGHKQKLVCTRTQEKGAVTPQETYPDLPVISRSLRWRCGSAVACCMVGSIECSSACMGHFEGGLHYPHYLHHSLASGQTTRRGDAALPFNRKLD